MTRKLPPRGPSDRHDRCDPLAGLRRAARVARWAQTLLLVAAGAAVVWWLAPRR